jgi:hypothetical protein
MLGCREGSSDGLDVGPADDGILVGRFVEGLEVGSSVGVVEGPSVG